MFSTTKDHNLKKLCIAIRARHTPMSFGELHYKILDNEMFLNRDNDSKGTSFIPAQYNQQTINSRGRQYFENNINIGSYQTNRGNYHNLTNTYNKKAECLSSLSNRCWTFLVLP